MRRLSYEPRDVSTGPRRSLSRRGSLASLRAFVMSSPLPSQFVRHGLRVLIVDAAGVGFADSAVAPVRLGGAADGAAEADLHYVVEPWRPAWGAGGRRFRVSRDGALCYLGSDAEALRQWLLGDIERQASRRCVDGLRVRGAAVVWRGRSILIPARGRIGTATLADALVDAGADRLADAVVVLDDAGRARGPDGRPDAPAPPLALVVATTYRPGLPFQPRLLRGALAALPLVDSAHPGRGGAGTVLRCAARLAGFITTLQGPRGEASLAAPHILATLEAEMAREAPPRRTVVPAAFRRAEDLLRARAGHPAASEAPRW